MKKQVKYCEWGLANNYGTHIEINKELKHNKLLRNVVVKHELKHTEEFDLKTEFDSSIWGVIIPLFIFIINNPKTWIDFIPIQYKNKQIIYDSNMFILYFLIAVMIFILVKLF